MITAIIALTLLTFAAAAGRLWLDGRVPYRRVIWFELAGTEREAADILSGWGQEGKQSALWTILFDFVLALLWIPLAVTLCLYVAVPLLERKLVMAVIAILMALLAVVAGMFAFGADAAMLRTIRKGPKGPVRLTRICALGKLRILALIATFLIFRVVWGAYEWINVRTDAHPYWAAVVLTGITAILGLRFLRAAAPLHPTLLSFQLAPTRCAANRVLEKWGPCYMKVAKNANWQELIFAVAYCVSLAILCFRLQPWSVPRTYSSVVTQVSGWLLLVAATLQVVQNLSTYFALRVREMGWWRGLSSFSGNARIMFLTFSGVWLLIMFLHWEVEGIRFIAAAILRMTQ